MMNPCHVCNCLHANGSCSLYHNCNRFKAWFAKEWRSMQMLYGVIEQKPAPKKYKGNDFIWRVFEEGGFYYD